MENQGQTDSDAIDATVLKVRIDPELHAELVKRCSVSQRAKSTELVRLAKAGLAQQQTLGARSDNGFDLLLAYSVRGVRGAIEELLQHATPMELRQYILSVEAQSGRSA